jgi:Fe-S-cluster containining protein
VSILNNDKFPCDRCGNCCRSIKNNSIYSFLDRGDGVCNYLDEKTNLCKIYDNRPNVCRVDDFYRYVEFMLTKQEYYEINKSLCKIFKEGN